MVRKSKSFFSIWVCKAYLRDGTEAVHYDYVLVRAFFSPLLVSLLWRPLSPVCALGTSPKRGSASRQRFRTGAVVPLHSLGAPIRGAGGRKAD